MKNHDDTLQLAESKKYSRAASTMGKEPSADTLLYALDKGMLLHRAGRFDESFSVYSEYFPQFKLSAEQEVSSSFWRSGLAAFGSVFDQLTGSSLVGTGTYRYAYGLQLYGRSAKYHCSTVELGRVATFQLLNAIKNKDLNAGRVAMQHLVDLQSFQREYTEQYPFLDYSYNELLTLVFLGMMQDDSGSAEVAFNRAVSANERARNSFSPDLFRRHYTPKFSGVTSVFNNAYERNLSNALSSYARDGNQFGLNRQEIMSTRLVTQRDYDQLRTLVKSKNIDPLVTGISKYYKESLSNVQECLNENESLFLAQKKIPDDKGCAMLIVEVGTVPGIYSARTEIPYSFLDKYTPPDTSMAISFEPSSGRSKHVKPIVLFDPDLFLQLDYQIYLDMLTERVTSKISHLEKSLCSDMVSYYSSLNSYRSSIQTALDGQSKQYFSQLASELQQNEPVRRREAYNRARSSIKSMRYDKRIWRSQPNKVYLAVINDLEPGTNTVTIRNRAGVLKKVSLDVKAGALTFDVIADL